MPFGLLLLITQWIAKKLGGRKEHVPRKSSLGFVMDPEKGTSTGIHLTCLGTLQYVFFLSIFTNYL